MPKNILVVTGGAGFIGSNLINALVSKTSYEIISIDNYFSGSKLNHIKNKKVKYINGNTKNISKILSNKKRKIKAIFHFGEFSRIAKSFSNLEKLYDSNIFGTLEVIEFCRKNKIKIIYSATSAAFGNNFKDANLSPYSFTKTKNLDLILNYHDWYKLSYEIIYFYNVYGANQIQNNYMGAVIGIFENCVKNNKPLTVVRPGSQARHFTHINDTIDIVLKAFRRNKNSHYSISAKKSYKILDVAKMFNHKYKLVPERPGERFVSTFVKKVRNKKVIIIKGKKDLKNYLKEKYESC
jgi:UDP-glucose 4-epimerase